MKQLLILEKEMLKSGEVEDKYGKLQQSNLRSFLPFSLSYIDLPSYIDLKTNKHRCLVKVHKYFHYQLKK